MLVLTRRISEETLIGTDAAAGPADLFDKNGNRVQISITVLGIKGNTVRFEIACPNTVVVDRSEINERRRREFAHASAAGDE